jgi:hypothetical protein
VTRGRPGLDRIDPPRAGLTGEVGEKTGSGADVDDHVASLDDGVDRFAVPVDALGVGEHAAVVRERLSTLQQLHPRS